MAKRTTFEEVSRPYLFMFGEPDETFDIHLDDNHYRQYYWYKPDVVVEFVAPKKNTYNGWKISFSFSLNPLKYYKNK